jgi:DNA polymerase-3 subunit gamma/tau
LIDAMGLQGATRQLAANCVWLGREGATVRLALDANVQSLHTGPKAAKLEQALARHFGAPVRLQIERIDGPPDTLARSLEQAAAARAAQARAAFEADPVVGAFTERFGASVLGDSVRPVDSNE